jgi:hypothetical protein
MKQLVKDAITQEEIPLDLASSVRERLGTDRRRFFGCDSARWMMATAAVVVLAIGSIAAVWWGRVAPFAGDDSDLIQTVSARVGEMLRVGLVDHVHCTILLGRWKRFVSLDEMKVNTGRQALGPEFIGLVPAVHAKLGTNYKIVQGHRCTANHREYVHLILTGSNNAIVSLVITEKQDESFMHADAIAVMQASGIPIYRNREGIYEIAGFESDKYLAYIVSNLDRDSNLNVASILAPVVYDHLHRLEL